MEGPGGVEPGKEGTEGIGWNDSIHTPEQRKMGETSKFAKFCFSSY
jgi:hypothetical protein